jgi:hypothetical protein
MARERNKTGKRALRDGIQVPHPEEFAPVTSGEMLKEEFLAESGAINRPTTTSSWPNGTSVPRMPGGSRVDGA